MTSRVSTAGPLGGTSGNGVRSLPAEALKPGEVVLPGVRMLDGFRTNVGVVTGDRWTDIEYRLRSDDGMQIAQRFLSVPPRTLRQLSIEQIFGSSVTVPDPIGTIVVSSDRPFLTYMTVIDGTSQDPVFVMP